MKLEVGMYVRTNMGDISKIKSMWENERVFFEDKVDIDYFTSDSFGISYLKRCKASHNIIDLIEVGDILEINNEKYEVIYDESYEKLGILIPSKKELSIRHSSLEYVFKKYKVSIVTKEQFESMKYSLEG